MTDSLSKIFDVSPNALTRIPDEQQNSIVVNDPIPAKEIDEEVEADFQEARVNIQNLLKKGEILLTTAVSMAQSSEHPRAIEVAGNLIAQLALVNKGLIQLHQDKMKVAPIDEAPKSVTNNTLFVGSTDELNRMLTKLIKGE